MSLETTLTLLLAAGILVAALLIQLLLWGVFRVLGLVFRGGRGAVRHYREPRIEDAMPRATLRERVAPVATGAVAGTRTGVARTVSVSRTGLGHARTGLGRAKDRVTAIYNTRMDELAALLSDTPDTAGHADVIQLDDARDLTWDPLSDSRLAAGGHPLIDPGFH